MPVPPLSVTPSPTGATGLDPRRKRLLFRAWHRGTREMDLIMGRFAEAEIAGLDDGDLDVFEALLDESDHTVYGWVVGQSLPPERYETPLFSRIRAFDHAAHDPRDG